MTLSSVVNLPAPGMEASTKSIIVCSQCTREDTDTLPRHPTDNAIRRHFATIGWTRPLGCYGKPVDVCPDCS